ncbi:MAG TPA: hypothetical protein VGP08_15625 [Pyrinomonadaceae bacterium]|jgi:type I restriction-modification system DNA methylase subunit|nr:hypothetical protein [Pyrinomonadaceae bacterium]
MLDVKNIVPSNNVVTASEIQKRHDEAFDARQVAREFRRDYERVFRRVEGMIECFDDGSADRQRARGERARKRLFTLRLFSRMMLAAFVRKNDRLRLDAVFEETADERDADIIVPDAALDAVVNDLFARYDFTAHEGTPTDVEVAVDPEMLGKVFEEFVPTRGESGSYYTPKPVVSFMCRESLKGYLGDKYASLVDEHDASDISVHEARRLLSCLARVRVVDLACGSGAYLLGMLHELHALTRAATIDFSTKACFRRAKR